MKPRHFMLPLALLVLAACSTANRPPVSAAPASGGDPATQAEAVRQEVPPVPVDQVRDDIARPGTKSNAVISRNWEGLGSTGGGTGTGIGIGTTADEPAIEVPPSFKDER